MSLGSREKSGKIVVYMPERVCNKRANRVVGNRGRGGKTEGPQGRKGDDRHEEPTGHVARVHRQTSILWVVLQGYLHPSSSPRINDLATPRDTFRSTSVGQLTLNSARRVKRKKERERERKSVPDRHFLDRNKRRRRKVPNPLTHFLASRSFNLFIIDRNYY